MSSAPAAPSLEQIAELLQASEGKTPSDVLAAFLPDRRTAFGQRLVPLTAGHDLLLEKLAHPFARPGTEWKAHDLAVALLCFTRPSRELFQLIEDGTFEDAVFELLDSLPFGDLDAAAAELVAHWATHRATALSMRSPHSVGEKKTAGSAGGSIL
jgi:hypothetical protein